MNTQVFLFKSLALLFACGGQRTILKSCFSGAIFFAWVPGVSSTCQASVANAFAC